MGKINKMRYRYNNNISFQENMGFIREMINKNNVISDGDVSELIDILNKIDVSTINKYSSVELRGNVLFTINNDDAMNYDIKVITPSKSYWKYGVMTMVVISIIYFCYL